MTQPLLLETRNLDKFFDHEGRRIHVLKGVNLEIASGERLAVVGRSGAGKSTLLHVLGTLDRPSAGELFFEGENVFSLSSKKLSLFRNSAIGFMFQFHHLLPEFTALENVAMPLLIARRGRQTAMEAAEKWLLAVGLQERMTHRPGELSGGEQQRVALARALVMHPKILMADEPTGNLDSRTSDGIHELFSRINDEHGTAMLVVTHNRELASRMPRCLEMADGLLHEVNREALA